MECTGVRSSPSNEGMQSNGFIASGLTFRLTDLSGPPTPTDEEDGNLSPYQNSFATDQGAHVPVFIAPPDGQSEFGAICGGRASGALHCVIGGVHKW